MGEPTGTLTVSRPDTGTQVFSWNGDADDREAAREAFDGLMKTGYYLAYVFEAPSKARQVHTFADVLEAEKELGVVTAQITPALQGG